MTATQDSGTILVVEDDRDVRDAIRDLLTDAGYVVETASEGRAALDFLSSRERRVSLVLLDLVLPGMDGWEVLKALEATRVARNLSIIVLSGVPDAPVPLPGVRWVRKPIEPDVLLATIRAAFAVRAGA